MPNDYFALYVGSTAISTGFPVTVTGGDANQDITDFKLRFSVDTGTINVDNFVITQAPEPGSMAVLLLAAPVAWAVARRRRSGANGTKAVA